MRGTVGTLVVGLLLAAPVARAAGVDQALLGGMAWRELGPFRGGWATSVAGVPNEPDRFYFGGADGGVWRTDDAGRTWQAEFQHGPAGSIGAIAVAPSDPRIIYIGTGQVAPRYDVAAGAGVFRSDDGGRSWHEAGLSDTRHIGRIWVDPTNPEIVMVAAQGQFFGHGTARGVYRSTDGGRSWTRVLYINDTTGVVDLVADPHNPKLMFAAAWDAQQYPWQSYFTPVAGPGSGIYRSDDGGLHWQRLSGHGLPAGSLGRISLAATDTAAGARIYAVIDGGGDDKKSGLYRSDDGGGTWRRVNPGEAFTNYYASRITVAPNDPDVVYTVGQSIRRCVAGGTHCTIIKGSPGGDDYHVIWINPLHPDHIITGSDQGAVVSVNGGATWSSWYNQPTVQVYHIAADNRFPYWIYAGQQDSGTIGIASRSDYGAISWRDWHPVGGDERDDDIPDPTDPDIVYASGLGGKVTKWDARTGQVQNITPWPISSYGMRPTKVTYHYLWVTPLAISATGPVTLYLGAQTLFASTDRGKTWSVISPDLTGKQAGATHCGGNPDPDAAKACGYGSIAVIEPSPRHAKEIWVGSDDGMIWLTRDGGRTWQDIAPKSVAAWGKIACLDVSSIRDGVAYAVVDGQRTGDFAPHILKTDDYGKSWTEIDHGLPAGHFVASVRADSRKPGLLYAGTEQGVFVSFDDGGQWQRLGRNFPTTWVRDLLVHDNDLIAGTQGRGIWVLDDLSPLREMTSTLAAAPMHLFTPAPSFRVHPDNNADTPPPPETPLGQNPPGGAIIDYWLGATPKTPVVLTIRDARGEVIRRFASNETPVAAPAELYFARAWTRPPHALPASPGFHRFVWNLRYAQPRAIHYTYSIAAVWGKGTPALPLGPYVLPGTYTVTLSANGVDQSAKLVVTEDPRVRTSATDLRASLALSERIVPALDTAWVGEAERQAVLAALDKAAPKVAAARTAAAKLRAGPDVFDKSDSILGGIETDLEGVDAAPTAAQVSVVGNEITRLHTAYAAWQTWRKTTLPQVNIAVKTAGLAAISVPPVAMLKIASPDAGADLP